MAKPTAAESSLEGLSYQSFESVRNLCPQHGEHRYEPLMEYHYSEATMSATSPLLTTLSTNSAFGNPSKMHQSPSSLTQGFVFPVTRLPTFLLGAADAEWSMFDSNYSQSWQSGCPPSYCGSVSDSGDSDTMLATHLGESASSTETTDGRSSSSSQPSISTSESRRIRRQQQNRKAQRTYRERQTALLTTAKEQVRDLTKKLDDLNRTNAALEVRAKALSDRVGFLERTKNGLPHRHGDFESFDFPQLR